MDNINLTGSLGSRNNNQAHQRVYSMLKSPTDLRVPVKRAATHPQIKQHKQNQKKELSISNDTNSNESQSNDSNSDGDGDDGGGDDDSDRQGSKHSQSLKYQYQTRPQLPQQGFVRLREILQVIPVSKSTWWAGVKSGRYPQPVRSLGKRITAWRVEEIQSLINDAF